MPHAVNWARTCILSCRSRSGASTTILIRKRVAMAYSMRRFSTPIPPLRTSSEAPTMEPILPRPSTVTSTMRIHASNRLLSPYCDLRLSSACSTFSCPLPLPQWHKKVKTSETSFRVLRREEIKEPHNACMMDGWLRALSAPYLLFINAFKHLMISYSRSTSFSAFCAMTLGGGAGPVPFLRLILANTFVRAI